MREIVNTYRKTLKSGKYWYVRFWSEEKQKYCNDKATGVKVVGKEGGRNKAKNIGRILYSQIVENQESNDTEDFLTYLYEHWHPESEYCTHKKDLRGKPLTNSYLTNCKSRIRNHVSIYKPFKDIDIHHLTSGMFQKWMQWSKQRGTGVHTINDTLDAMNIALEWKVFKGELQRNPIKGLGRYKEESEEKGILTSEEQQLIPDVKERNPRVKLGCLLSMLGSLRLGEVRGLRWSDIDFEKEIITIEHSYNDTEGLKSTKNDIIRYIPLMPQYLPLLSEIAEIHCGAVNPSDFVLYNQARKDRPMGKESIYKGYKRILNKIGITEENRKEKNITFHSFRHTFVSEAYKRGLSKFEVKALAGHLTDEMSAHYTHEAQAISMSEVKKKLI